MSGCLYIKRFSVAKAFGLEGIALRTVCGSRRRWHSFLGRRGRLGARRALKVRLWQMARRAARQNVAHRVRPPAMVRRLRISPESRLTGRPPEGRQAFADQCHRVRSFRSGAYYDVADAGPRLLIAPNRGALDPFADLPSELLGELSDGGSAVDD